MGLGSSRAGRPAVTLRDIMSRSDFHNFRGGSHQGLGKGRVFSGVLECALFSFEVLFLVEYLQDGITKFDICSAGKQVDIFDHYWDHYRRDFVNMTQTEGRVNPKLWQDPSSKKDSNQKRK